MEKKNFLKIQKVKARAKPSVTIILVVETSVNSGRNKCVNLFTIFIQFGRRDKNTDTSNKYIKNYFSPCGGCKRHLKRPYQNGNPSNAP